MIQIAVEEGGYLPQQVADLEPPDLRMIARGVRKRRMEREDLAAFCLAWIINTGAGVYKKKSAKTVRIHDILGRRPVSEDKPVDRKAEIENTKKRAERYEAIAKAKRKNKQAAKKD